MSRFFFARLALIFLIPGWLIPAVPIEAYKPKIYDCFTFYNELEVLDIKLHELYDHVDYFVLVESVETFRGKPKRLHFQDNKERYERFLDKIIHVVIEDRQPDQNGWTREAYQRNQILRGLTGCRDDDIVIIEDLDEIINPSRLPDIIEPLLTNKLRYVPCSLDVYTYYLNRYGHPGNVTAMLCSVAAKYADVKSRTPQGIRDERNFKDAIAHAGWHLTYMGGIRRVINKIENFAHAELDYDAYKDPLRIQLDAEALPIVPIGKEHPQFVQNNIAYFEELGLIDNLNNSSQLRCSWTFER